MSETKVDVKRARGLADSLAREGLDYKDEEAMLRRLAYEVERLRELLRGLHRCDSHDDVSNAWGCPDCVRELREERKTKWKPLLAAAKVAEPLIAQAPDNLEAKLALIETIAACEEK